MLGKAQNAYELCKALLLECSLFSVASALFYVSDAEANWVLHAVETDTRERMWQPTEDATEIFRNAPGAAECVRPL
jgi:hypothetical protein